jgi:membrane-bound ClpP family serine protease
MLALETFQIVLLVILILVILTPILIVAGFIKIWAQALASGVRVPFIQILGMYLRKVSPQSIISAKISTVMAGITDVPLQSLEVIFLIRRNPEDVMTCVKALIMAHKANLEISLENIYQNYFAGEDVVKMIQDRINGGEPTNLQRIESSNDFQGKSGRTVSTVYSAGIVEIDSRQYNAVTENEVIEENTPIRVSQVEGNYLVIVPA